MGWLWCVFHDMLSVGLCGWFVRGFGVVVCFGFCYVGVWFVWVVILVVVLFFVGLFLWLGAW